jgi:NAD dependent epimerase/dehydratase
MGKNVLVTGADGFIGSHLVEFLVHQGCQVTALCYYNSFSSWGWLDHSAVRDEIRVVLGDVRDPQQMMDITKGMDMVFHLAALIAIPYSYHAPSSYVDTNVTGTLNLLQAAKHHGVERFIHTSTSEVYGTAQYVPIDEAHPIQAQSPYSASKIGADAMAYSFHCSYETPVVTARPFNTYGPRQSARALIPTVITQLLDGQTTLRLGAVTPTRDFNYVQDTCAGFWALANAEGVEGQVVNIGSGTEISVEETAQLIAKLIGVDVTIETDEQRLRPEASEVERLCCGNARMKELTGFAHQIDLEEGLRHTIEWFKKPENRAFYKAGRYNV